LIFAPGHSPGHLCFYCRRQGFLIGGDVLFKESIGRTDLPGGNHATLISSIKTKLFALPDETVVYSGHGPATTIGHEKKHNPFLV
jgi:hydroxyacylglutathione hydrolase